MRILHIASGDRWGGAEAQILTLLTQLRQTPSLQLHVVLLNDRELAHRLRTNAIDVTIFDEEYLSVFTIIKKLRQLMLKWQPQIVHTHRQKENVLGAIANRFATCAPTVRTSHGAPEHPPKGLQLHRWVFRWLDDWCGRHWQDRIIAVSQDLAKQLANNFPTQRIVVVENGVDVHAIKSAITPVDFRLNKPSARHIGIAGRLDPVKRVDIFLDMAALLRRNHPEEPWQFHIFGDGKLSHQLKSQAVSLRIQDIVTFHGHRDDIIPCLAGLDALVMCSDHEGLPMTLLESLVVGTPIVGHAVGGILQILGSTPFGRLVHEHQPFAYADALISLLSEGPPNHCLIPEIFTAEHNRQSMLQLYSSLVSNYSPQTL